jgi:diguanylate cyclase (GGDEF)-like protein
MVFLITTLAYSFWVTRSVLLDEARQNMDRTVQLLAGQLESTKTELQRYARIVRDEHRLQEYMFIVVRVSNEVEPLESLYKQQFGWLPVSRKLLLDDKGKFLMGDRQENFLENVRKKASEAIERTFTYRGENGLELVIISPVFYRGDMLGSIAISHVFDEERLEMLKHKSGGELFVVEKGSISASTVKSELSKPFVREGKHVLLGDEYYRVLAVDMPNMEPETPQLWFGMSEKDLTRKLQSHIQMTLSMIAIGGILILIVGIAILKNFSQPLLSLMKMTSKITAGELPAMGKTNARNEIESLSNQFADMLHSLREKQKEVDEAHERLEQIAITDTLTGLYNRRYLQDLFPKLKAQVERDNKMIGIILFDLDFFKRINDEYGHLCGDYCLSHFAWILKKYSRENDFVFRMGGEEFMILCLCDDVLSTESLAEKIRTAIQNDRIEFEGHLIQLTVSCGISTSDSLADKDLNTLLSQADAALYEVKNSGRNQVKLWSDRIIEKRTSNI